MVAYYLSSPTCKGLNFESRLCIEQDSCDEFFRYSAYMATVLQKL